MLLRHKGSCTVIFMLFGNFIVLLKVGSGWNLLTDGQVKTRVTDKLILD